jgi:hypothetical protein
MIQHAGGDSNNIYALPPGVLTGAGGGAGPASGVAFASSPDSLRKSSDAMSEDMASSPASPLGSLGGSGSAQHVATFGVPDGLLDAGGDTDMGGAAPTSGGFFESGRGNWN